MARVAMAHGVNANVLRRWVAEANGLALRPSSTAPSVAAAVAVASGEHTVTAGAQSAFVPVKVEMPTPSQLHIEITRGNVQIKVAWPLSAASQSALWLRELLR